MHPRPLEIFDLPKLARYRSKVVSLDEQRRLTRGNPLRAVNFLAYFNPARRIYTAIVENGESETLIGSLRQLDTESFARLAYVAPASALDRGSASLALIEHLVGQAKKWQAYQVLAEIEEESALFKPLRQSGFSVYGRQRIWDLSEVALPASTMTFWRKRRDADMIAIQRLQRQIVPPLLQQVESFSVTGKGLVCEAEELLAYMDVSYGARGIFLRPLIHPNADDVREKVYSLLQHHLVNQRERPVYLCVRSHQAWVETILDEMGASAGCRQVVMVKHLVNVQRVEKSIHAGADAAWVNPAAPVHYSNKERGGK